jgi:alkylation response protein AidB-like acyl-CoA dehydrogenase
MATFATTVRRFFAAVPEQLDGIDDSMDRVKRYRRLLHEAGLSGLTYPWELGGQAYPESYEHAFNEIRNECGPAEASALAIGLGMALPTILHHGTDEQRQRFIPSGLLGDDVWCQLYSEPGAGSDLASLATRAELDGDEWWITGQKVWTSGAVEADLAILLARTSWDLPKHRGITMFILDMNQPAVTVRPLVQMTGVAEFNEVFFDEARIPRHWVLGDVNEGWGLAVALMKHERATLGSGQRSVEGSKSGRAPIPADDLARLARRRGRIDDAGVRQELAALHSGERIVEWLNQRTVHPSITKLWRTIQGRRAAQLAHLLNGGHGMAWSADDTLADYYAYQVLNCRGMSLGGGTDEIQRNLLGERALGLPREPGPPPDTPFRDLLRNPLTTSGGT